MKVTREEFKELVEICQAAQFLDRNDLISYLVSWISDGLGLKEELFELMVDDSLWKVRIYGDFEDVKFFDFEKMYDSLLEEKKEEEGCYLLKKDGTKEKIQFIK